MKRRKITLAQLKQTWWWRKKSLFNPRKGFNALNGIKSPVNYFEHWGFERAARNYELMRRATGAENYPPFLEGGFRAAIARELWGKNPAQPSRAVAGNDFPKHQARGWTRAETGDSHRQWNLNLSDGTLKRAFIEYIKQQRAVQKIRPPVTKQANQKISWKYVEILDRNLHGFGGMDASERHQCTTAKKLATRYFEELETTIKSRPICDNDAFSTPSEFGGIKSVF